MEVHVLQLGGKLQWGRGRQKSMAEKSREIGNTQRIHGSTGHGPSILLRQPHRRSTLADIVTSRGPGSLDEVMGNAMRRLVLDRRRS